ncbi:MAG: tetratricopeptide repeat protein [Chthoniobacterales bacterium]|nr:tetratricopeptide repeat protein [Chthoniobacterales bacterium]
MFSKILQLIGLKKGSDSTNAELPLAPFVPPRPISRAVFEDTFGAEDLENTAEEYFMSGLSTWKLGDSETALDKFNTAIEYSPERADWFLNRGNLLAELGRYSDALSDFERALQINPALDDGVLFVIYHMIKQLGVDSPALKIVAEQNSEQRHQRSRR